MNTTRIEIVRHCFVFQKGVTLNLVADPSGAGYQVPDIGDGTAGVIPAEAVKVISNQKRQSANHDGKCLLTSVSSHFIQPEKQNDPPEDTISPERVSVFHYSDAQKIVFHLPRPAREGRFFRLLDRVTGDVIEQKPLIDKVNGSTMIIMDTLDLQSGFYLIRADWPSGWTHELTFIKYPAGFPNLSYPQPPAHIIRANKGDEYQLAPFPVIESRPAYSKIASDYANARDASQTVSKPKNIQPEGYWVDYTQDGRSGNVYYHEEGLTIPFWWEFAGGGAVAMIGIPEEKFWEPQTGTPLSRRMEILERLAAQVVKDQVPGGNFEIYFNSISIFPTKNNPRNR